MTITFEQVTQKLSTLCQQTEVWQSRFPAEVDNIQQLKQAFAAKAARLNSEGLKLSIGIMGQVKAGKSSFVNALLFDGKPILPEAATPKTANLTRISYGESPLLTVTFYTLEEWGAIKAQASSSGEHAEAKVGRDLLRMVAEQGLDVESLLAKQTETLAAQDVDGLMNKLNDYVGENGRYTALVKATEIQLPLDELKGYDVVDTPGMNDPVPSRTQKTREYMAQCDVVFFLSRCSQFLDQSDMDLLARQLPGNGIKRMVLVAGQFDGAISDDGFSRASLADTERNLTERLGRRAMAEIEKLATFRDEVGDTKIAEILRGLKTPIFSSTFAHGFSTWAPDTWGKTMRHVHKELVELARDSWNGYQFSQQDWLRIGNFASLQSAYQAARLDKQALLQAQRDGLVPDTAREMQLRMQALSQAAASRAQRLQKNDMASIDAKLKACEASIDKIAHKLSEVVDGVRQTSDATVRDVERDLSKDAKKSTNIKIKSGTEVEEYSYEVSVSRWYNPFSWGDTETRYSSSTVSYEYIATSDVIEKLVQYSNESTASLQHKFNQVVNLNTFRTDLKSALLSALDTSSEGFDPAEFRSLLEGTLDRIALPELEISLGNVSEAISSSFSGEVRDSDRMTALQQTHKDTVESIRIRLLASFKEAVQVLNKQLDGVQQSLARELAQDLQAERKQLKTAFADKDRELVIYAEIIAACQD
jgi:Dynamin family